jgi:ferrochelatase
VTVNTDSLTSPSRIAVLLMAYGTPRTRDDILPYYTDIRRGRPPTEEQLDQLVARYEAIAPPGSDILSPLAERTESQRRALQGALDGLTPDTYCVTLGLKHARPMIEEAVEELVADGITRIVCLVLAPHWSAFSVGQYVGRVRAAAEPHGVAVTAVESWATEPAFVEFLASDLSGRLGSMPSGTTVVFTAHSLPRRILDSGDPYPDQLRATAEAVSSRAGLARDQWSIGWQSAGRTADPWLGPDILEVLDTVAAEGRSPGVLVCACGFVADHLEVLYDLDIEASGRAAALGLAFTRTACVNDDASVMAALARRVVAAT